MAKYLFLSGVDLVCLKPTARTDRLSALRSSKATMLSVGSCNTDEWRDGRGGWRDTRRGGEKRRQQGEGWQRMRVDTKTNESGWRRDEYKHL